MRKFSSWIIVKVKSITSEHHNLLGKLCFFLTHTVLQNISFNFERSKIKYKKNTLKKLHVREVVDCTDTVQVCMVVDNSDTV